MIRNFDCRQFDWRGDDVADGDHADDEQGVGHGEVDDIVVAVEHDVVLEGHDDVDDEVDVGHDAHFECDDDDGSVVDATVGFDCVSDDEDYVVAADAWADGVANDDLVRYHKENIYKVCISKA